MIAQQFNGIAGAEENNCWVPSDNNIWKDGDATQQNWGSATTDYVAEGKDHDEGYAASAVGDIKEYGDKPVVEWRELDAWADQKWIATNYGWPLVPQFEEEKKIVPVEVAEDEGIYDSNPSGDGVGAEWQMSDAWEEQTRHAVGNGLPLVTHVEEEKIAQEEAAADTDKWMSIKFDGILLRDDGQMALTAKQIGTDGAPNDVLLTYDEAKLIYMEELCDYLSGKMLKKLAAEEI